MLILKVVLKNGTKVYADASDLQAMSEIMWTGSVSHNDLTGLGGTKDFAPHQLGHELSAKFDYAHGATLAADIVEEAGKGELEPEALRGHDGGVFVTPRDIDAQVRDLAKVIGYGINWALQDLEIEEITALLS